VSNVRLKALRPQRISKVLEAIIPWRLVQAHAGESARWESYDSRWVTVSLGHGDDLGKVIVVRGDGMRRAVESFEDALALAKEWRD
jgi:hypothetical protein